MRSDNIDMTGPVPEWVYKSTWTAADPLTVDEGPWPNEVDDDRRGSVVGFALLLLAFAAGFAAGWWAR